MRADDHCAVNVCLYGPGSNRWTMTERSAAWLDRSRRHYALGPSSLVWTGSSLVIDLDERSVPLPRAVRGRLRVHPQGLCRWQAALDADGRHRWGPIAPCARVEVDLASPSLRWQGHAYLDSNEGDEPIERPFVHWDWLRAPLPDGRCAVVYDTQPRQGPVRLLAARFAPDGSAERFEPPPRQALPATRWWRLRREACADAGSVRVTSTLEDTPFYARSLLRAGLGGAAVNAVHESLDLDRLRSPLVQRLLPFRMPRRA